MGIRLVRRGVAVAAVLVLAVSSVAFADTAPADADLLTAGNQGSRDLGDVVAGGTIDVAVGFTLRCANGAHAEQGSTIEVTIDSQTVPDGGAAELVTPASIGPVPSTWPLDGIACPGGTGSPSLAAAVPMTIRLTAPTTLGPTAPYAFSFARTPSTDITGIAGVAFTMTVVAPEPEDVTPPTLAGVPTGIDVVTADPTGVDVAWTDPSAIDDTDPAPAVSCTPVAGSRFAPGTTTVTCTAVDAAGNRSDAAFDITVHVGAAVFAAPLRATDPALVAEQGRVVPVKVRVELDGLGLTPESAGSMPRLVLTPLVACGGDASGFAADRGPLAWIADEDRWQGRLDTSELAPGCWRIGATVDGVALGSADLLVARAPGQPRTNGSENARSAMRCERS